MNTIIFLGNDDQKNLVGSKLTKFCSLCRQGMERERMGKSSDWEGKIKVIYRGRKDKILVALAYIFDQTI